MCQQCDEQELDYSTEVGCQLCGCVSQFRNYYGTRMCEPCIELEEETDWDKFEEDKRRSISESNEY